MNTYPRQSAGEEIQRGAFPTLTNHTASTLTPYTILTTSPSLFHLNHKNFCTTLLISEQRFKRREPDKRSAMRHFEKKAGVF